MEIIDNFGLSSKQDSSVNPWLERILNKVKNFSNHNFVLRLSGEFVGPDLIYNLNNNQNKTYAAICKRKNIIYVHLFQKKLPDPEREIKPSYEALGEYLFDSDSEGIIEASNKIRSLLDADTAYSLGRVVKIKVSPTPTSQIPWTFTGGKITNIEQAADNMLVIVEDGKCTYCIPNEQTKDQRISVLKYIVFNELGEFELINSYEFNFYFEMQS